MAYARARPATLTSLRLPLGGLNDYAGSVARRVYFATRTAR
jgi:hypothetical protein